MVKKNSPSNKLVILIVSAIVGVGALIGTYFIGYNVGKNDSQTPNNGQFGRVVGVYKRSYYNNYNVSVDSYAILRDDGSCKYIDSLKTELSTTVDFNDRSQLCTYTYDDSTKSGVISINYPYTVDGEQKDNIKTMNFTFNQGSLLIGGASYGKIQ